MVHWNQTTNQLLTDNVIWYLLNLRSMEFMHISKAAMVAAVGALFALLVNWQCLRNDEHIFVLQTLVVLVKCNEAFHIHHLTRYH
jgi:hypothetical protein